MKETEIFNALKEAYHREGTQAALANIAGISQGRIADYLNGRYAIGNMTVATLLKIFPDIAIDFFGGKSENAMRDMLRTQLLKIFNALDDAGKVRMIAVNAAKFGDGLKVETETREH